MSGLSKAEKLDNLSIFSLYYLYQTAVRQQTLYSMLMNVTAGWCNLKTTLKNLVLLPNLCLFGFSYLLLETKVTHTAHSCRPNLVSRWHCWLTVGMASTLSTGCVPGQAMTTLFISWHAKTSPFVLYCGPNLSKSYVAQLWFSLCWSTHGPPLSNHIWTIKRPPFFGILALNITVFVHFVGQS